MERVTYRGVVYTRNPEGKQRAHRVYFAPPRGSGRDLLHRDIYRDTFGTIPNGHHIHHVDGDPLNNEPSNLVALSPKEHAKAHADGSRSTPEWLRHLEIIRGLASQWHRSPEGRQWHREHARRMWEAAEPGEIVCEECGRTAEAWQRGKRFCSSACGRRVADREERYRVLVACPECGSEFWQSKYRQKPETCSRVCGARLRKRRSGRL